MDDYISREAAIKEIKAHICFACPFKAYSCTPEKCGTNAALKAISEIPAADVRPVARGRWEIKGDFAYCTVCKDGLRLECGVELFDGTPNFCPHCGADMRPEAAPVQEQPKEKKPKNVIHLWMDGYVCNGDSAGPSRCGVYEAETLRDAVIMWANEKPERWKDINMYSNPPKFWGCSFFDKKR